MSAATSRARIDARRQASASRAGGARRGAGLGTAIVIALIPLGVGLGVLVGHGSSSGDGKLLAALKAQKPENLYVGGGAAAGTSAATTGTGAPQVHTGFTSSSGYTIELSTLPAGTTQSAAGRAEAAAKAKGATGVGIVSVSDYSLTPKPSGAAFVIYAGDFTTRAAAARSLSKLKHAFPGAQVIAVKSSATAGAGKVVSSTRFGSATQATGYKPSATSLAQGASVASSVSKKIGKSYVGAQQGLPSVVSVP
jgi:hypothetical protein